MALEDCIAKFKGKITGDQIAALEAAKDEGLTDEQAVRRVLLAAQVNVIDIADRARKQGAKLAPVPNPVSDVAKFQAATLEKIKAEREALTAENAKLKEELSDIETVRAGVKRESGVGPGLSEQELQEIDLTKPQELTGLSNLLFRNKEGLKRGVFGLKGSTPLELAASYDKLLAREPEIAARQAEIAKEIDALDARVSKVFSGTGKQTFFQDKARAEITFNEQNQAIIRLTEAKDLTSFLHEGAHLYLEMLGDLVERPDANAGMVEDYKKILKYLGVSSREEIGADQHELFARSFEAYLREGIAPTAELQPLFSDFKGWFTLVYKKITQLLGVTESLSDDIRGVFDRLVASDEAISQSEDMMQYVQLFQNAEEMGISQEAFDVYKLNMQRSHQDAVDIESAKMIRAMKWSEQQWWNDERDKIAVDVRKKAEAMPVYRALAMLQNGKRPDGSDTGMAPFKLNRDDLINRYGKDFIKRLPGRGTNGVYRIEGGVDADVAAMVFGFESGDAMIKAMIASRPMEAWIRAEANRIMRENHPDPKNSPELFNDATIAVHNQKRGRILAAELSALRRKQREDAKIVRATKSQIKREDKQAREANKGQIPTRENLALVKAAARHVIGKKRIRDVNPNTYLQAERKAGRLAFEAMGKKDYAEAYYQKLVQIRNFEAYRAAVAAKKSWESTQRYLKSFEKLPKRRRMGKAGKLDQIDAVMEGIDLRKLSLTRIDREKIENELSEAIKAGRIVTTPEIAAMLKNPGGTNWKDLTVETFAGIRDVVKQLEHQARTDLKAIVNGEEVILKEARDEVAGSIIANNGKVMIPRGEGDFWKDTKRNGRQALGQWLRHGTMARVLDKADFGAVTRRIVVPIRRAYTEKLLPRLEKAAEDVAAIYKKHYTNDELIQLGKPLSEKTMGEYMSKADILSLALNWGSESNRAAVLGGMMKDEYGNKTPAYTHAGVAQALARLDARDWAFVQDVWDYQNSYWPEMAETEKRRRGIAPQKIEALPFTIRTSDGQEVSVRGGYMHLQYNPEHGGHVSQNEIDEIGDKIKHGGFVTAGTRAGATYERTEAKHGRVVRLSLNTIDQNLREIIRDITIGDEISFANNILQSNEVNNAARNTNNSEALKSLQLWLTDAAVGELPANNSIEKALGWIRVGFTKSKLAFNVYVTALQLTGIFQSIAVLGLKNFSIGFGKFASSPAANYKMVIGGKGIEGKSKFMNTRYGLLQTWNRDVADTTHFLRSSFGPAPTKFKNNVDKMGHLYFYPIAKMQSLVDVITWMGAYEKGLNEENLSDRDAVFYADTVVENAQTSGLFSDRSGLERGTVSMRTRQSQYVRLFTSLISYMLAKGNIAYEKGVRTNFKDPKQFAYFVSDMLLLFTIEGIASALLYGQWPGDDDKDESVLGWMAGATLESMAAGIPIIRDFASAKYGGGTTPASSLVIDTYKFYEQVEQLEFDETLVKSGVKVTGTMLHLPSSQFNRAVEAAFKDAEGDAAWYEYLIGAKEK